MKYLVIKSAIGIKGATPMSMATPVVTECRSKQEALNILNGEVRGFRDGVKRFRKVAESRGDIVAECFHTHDEILTYTIVKA